MIHSVDGMTGNGKTLFLMFMAYVGHMSGYKLLSNFGMKLPYTKIENIDDFLKLEEGKYMLLGDELYRTMDAYEWANDKVLKFVNEAMQMRKKKIELYMSAQDHSFNHIRLRQNTAKRYRCNVWPEESKRIAEVRPVWLIVDWWDTYDGIIHKWRIPVKVPGLYDLCEMYDTYETVDSLKYGDMGYLHYVEKYRDTDYKSKKSLVSHILVAEEEEGNTMKKGRVESIVDYIHHLNTTDNE